MTEPPVRRRSGPLLARELTDSSPRISLHEGFLALVTILEHHAQEDIPQLSHLSECRRWYTTNPQLAWTHLITCLEAHLGYAVTLR
mgnify:CR=1 FL=1